MAIEFVVQRLQIGDFVRIDLPEKVGKSEAKVAGSIEQNGRCASRCASAGREDFVKSGLSADGHRRARPLAARRLAPGGLVVQGGRRDAGRKDTLGLPCPRLG